jgi:hypothetical protein
MIDASSILQMITLAVVGWVLLELIDLKTKVAALSQKINDLPCDVCNFVPKIETKIANEKDHIVL